MINRLNAFIAPWEEYDFSSQKKSVRQKVKEGLKKVYLWSQREIAIRAVPALKFIKKMPHSHTVLEVGSGPLGLSRYIRRPIVGVDISTKGPHFGHMQLVKANAWELPFRDNTFDCVVSLDMLEHIPRVHRAACIAEMLRVTKQTVVLCCPCGKFAQQWEAKVRGIYHRILQDWPKDKYGKDGFISRNSFLLEHHEHTIPTVEEIEQYISQSGSKIERVTMEGNEGCRVWYWGVLGHMKHSYLRWFLTTVLFILLFPILSRCTWGGTYRMYFFIEKMRAHQ